ncbi:MAG: DUF6259 domain-containing protein [Acidobacteriota bacterium]
MPSSRREFLGSALAASASGLVANAATPAAAQVAAGRLVLQNEHLLVVVDRETGCVEKLESKDGAWKMRGEGMRLHVPDPEHRYNFVTERNAVRPTIDVDGNQATITWRGFQNERMGKLDIEVKESIRLSGARVEFSYEIQNNSQAVIESYTYPRLRNLRPPAGEHHMHQLTWGYSSMDSVRLWPNFQNRVGYYGFDYPAQMRYLGTQVQFCLISSDRRGIYVGYHDTAQKQVVQLCFFLVPGYVDSVDSSDLGEGRLGDSAVGIDPSHLCFIQPGNSQKSETLAIEPFIGDWHAGVDVYKDWRRTWFKPPKMPQWLREVHSWQQIQINSAEDRLEFPYKDLPRKAEACKRWGVKAIQLTGWQIGGQDRDFPLHDTDPRLGTRQELKDAIAASRKMGVEVVLFNKYKWADITSPAYKTQFQQYSIEDPYGIPYPFPGYNYDTPTQLAGLNTRLGVGMCAASPLWRRRALVEFRKSVELGASGILYDECAAQVSSYCFSKNHDHPFPSPTYLGCVPLIEEFRTIVDGDDFVFAGESPFDIELLAYNMSYFRIGPDSQPVGRYIDPFVPMMVAVTGYNDRQMINTCLMYRYSISYEPRNFHGDLDEFPATMVYGGAVDELRRRYREWLWDAEFRHTLGAKVIADGTPIGTYSVFRREDGSRAVVIANMSDTKSVECELMLDSPNSAHMRMVSPEQLNPKPWPGKLKLAPGAAVVVLEG